MRSKKGISPIIATVILVAVTLVIAVAIVGWLMGLWGGMAGGSPAIKITNQKMNVTGTSATLVVYIKNEGGGSDKLLSIEVLSGGSVIGSYQPTSDVVISANTANWFTYDITLSQSVNVGDKVLVKLYFETSGTQQFEVTVTG
jgi:flagellin-like protein